MVKIATHHFSRPIWITLFFVFIALLPVMILRDFSPANELRYLSIADEALSDGTFFTFHNHGAAYADKPPLYLWIVMLGRLLFGNNCMGFLSLFSLIPAFVVVLVMDRWSRGEVREQFRVDAMLLTLTTGLFTGMTVFLRMDMLMTMWITLALYTFFRMYHGKGNRRLQRILFPIYIFLGIFTKGPMAILIPLVATTVFLWENKRLREWRLYWGGLTWGILILLCGAWFGAVWTEGGNEYLDNLLFNQTVNRAVNSFHHKRPFWYYLVSMWYTFMPWAFLIIGAAIAGFLRKTRVRNDIDRFYLTTGISTLVLLSFISSKIQVYLLPAYPFFCYLAAIYMSRYPGSKWLKAAIAVPVTILAVAGVALWIIVNKEQFAFLDRAAFLIAGGLLSLTALFSLYYLYIRKKTNIAVRIMAAGLFVSIFAASFEMPVINDRSGYRHIAREAMHAADIEKINDIYVYGMNRPENLDVFFGERPFTIVELQDSARIDSIGDAVIICGNKGIYRFPEEPKTQIGDEWVVVHRVSSALSENSQLTTHN